IRRGRGELVARIAAAPRDWSEGELYPAQLDAAFQALSCLLPADDRAARTLVVAGAEQVTIHRAPTGEVWCHATLATAAAGASPPRLTADVRLCDAAGQLLVEVAGLAIRVLPRARLADAPLPWDDRLFAATWQPVPRPASVPPEPGHWIVVDDSAESGAVLAERLRAAGHTCAVIAPAHRDQVVDRQALAQTSSTGRHLFEDPQALVRRLGESSGGRPLRGVICLSGLDASGDGWGGDGALRRVLALAQALCRMPVTPRLWLVTRGACWVGTGERSISISGAALWGLGRVVAQEHPELDSVLVDLAPEDGALADALWPVLAVPAERSQWAIRGDAWYRPRLVAEPAGDVSHTEHAVLPEGPYRLTCGSPGELDALGFAAAERRAAGPGEIEIAVEAVGLNFRDVLTALGMLPGQIERLGFECAGRVVGVGEGVTGFAVDDAVMALAPGSFRRTVVIDARLAAKRPAGMTAAEAATIPVAFLTAWYALHELAQLAAGERVLIHAASGGVGMAAIQIARRAGATVLGTASGGKAGVLRALGIASPLSSRSAAFADGVAAQTAGAGVDVVLNSLSGELTDPSVRSLARGGRFVEMGKLGIWTAAEMAARRPDVAYLPFDLMEVDPDRIQAMLGALVGAFERGELTPLPRRVFGFGEVSKAFRYMGNALHVGKVVLVPDAARGASLIDGAGSYLVTGGSGALGRHVVRWLAAQGARHIVVCGRRAPGGEAEAAFAGLRATGVDVRAELADVSDEVSTRALLARIGHDLPPLRGVIHAAGVLDDGGLLQQDPARFAAVLGPKIDGAWQLDRQTAGLPLELFVMFSSVSALVGTAGQSNYAAANAALDALAHHRRLRGLPGLSVNWGPWSGGGMAASIDASRAGAGGLAPLAPDEALAALRTALERDLAQVAVVRLARDSGEA
ncbi:MAG TPA: SDR family NAD(P)-dependent oxidoreductase, partial [Kofleriaceae bacterium]|nr:SDR family NAD(P)-dependent oxidoreductase [Kofleriaceae bacterium]